MVMDMLKLWQAWYSAISSEAVGGGGGGGIFFSLSTGTRQISFRKARNEQLKIQSMAPVAFQEQSKENIDR